MDKRATPEEPVIFVHPNNPHQTMVAESDLQYDALVKEGFEIVEGEPEPVDESQSQESPSLVEKVVDALKLHK